ncbi:MAG: cytochrome c peroxidase [Bacteroidota bacterium]
MARSSSRLVLVLFFGMLSLGLHGCDNLFLETTGNGTDIAFTFRGSIDPNNPANYANQAVPRYINRDNTQGNAITDHGAMLGRVLFYDTKLSVDNTVSCASCHQQQAAFGDPDVLSAGVNGLTGRQSMRLVNPRFATERRFFWDERANTLEVQTTMPIQDHIEMGFSGENGAPTFADLTERMSGYLYYQQLFNVAFGTPEITEERMQLALAQFVRSIQAFDSRFDEGRMQAGSLNAAFPNFTVDENTGKQLFFGAPQFQGRNRVGGGLGCGGCHRGETLDIDPQSLNNGVVSNANGGADFTVTRSPSLRDLFAPQGHLNTPLMHDGSHTTIDAVLDHYNIIDGMGNPNLDQRLARGGGQRLNITADERVALIAFLKTLTSQNLYTDEKWSDPFPR